jgi:hypothetical protein
MFGSVGRVGLALGEAVGVAVAVGVDAGRGVLEAEAEALGLGSLLQPASSSDAASGMASRAAEVLINGSLQRVNGGAKPGAGTATLGVLRTTAEERDLPNTIPTLKYAGPATHPRTPVHRRS